MKVETEVKAYNQNGVAVMDINYPVLKVRNVFAKSKLVELEINGQSVAVHYLALEKAIRNAIDNEL